MSTPILLLGRSRRCPWEAATTYFEPRIWPTVRALAGDSTITRLLPAEFSFFTAAVLVVLVALAPFALLVFFFAAAFPAGVGLATMSGPNSRGFNVVHAANLPYHAF